jgi:23S rRNA pseudouridine1911/1915/1917 synthase
MLTLNVNQSDSRLDQFLAEALSLSRTDIQAKIKSGKVLVNDKLRKASYNVSVDDIITIDDVEDVVETSEDIMTPLDFLYEDEDILIINKPVGLVVHPNDVQSTGTLTDALIRYFPGIQKVGASGRPGIVHRLDKDTSGVMVIAKTALAYDSLSAQFKLRTVKKRYIAVVHGNIMTDHFTIDNPISRHTKKRHLQLVSVDGKPSVTEVYVLKRFNTKTIIEARPLSGRTHQIRVHLQHFGNPILEDPLYGKTVGGKGQQLQAFSLSFDHPNTQKRLCFSVPTFL